MKIIVIFIVLFGNIGNTKFWYGLMTLVKMNILEAYAVLQYSVIVVAVEIESKVMKL